MVEVIFETLIILIFRYPGAGLRWAVSRLWKSKKTFKDFLEEDSYINGIIGLLVIGLTITAIVMRT